MENICLACLQVSASRGRHVIDLRIISDLLFSKEICKRIWRTFCSEFTMQLIEPAVCKFNFSSVCGKVFSWVLHYYCNLSVIDVLNMWRWLVSSFLSVSSHSIDGCWILHYSHKIFYYVFHDKNSFSWFHRNSVLNFEKVR